MPASMIIPELILYLTKPQVLRCYLARRLQPSAPVAQSAIIVTLALHITIRTLYEGVKFRRLNQEEFYGGVCL